MYRPASTAILCEDRGLGCEDRYVSNFAEFWTNGWYVRNERGDIVLRELGRGARPKLYYFGDFRGESFRGSVEDRVIAKRIVTYIRAYAGKQFTNCSAFAHYLTTGIFTPCAHGAMEVVSGHMRSAVCGERVSVGDMLCIVYPHDWYVRSRKNADRGMLRKLQKLHHDTGLLQNSWDKGDVLSPTELRTLCIDEAIDDYHFMVCVAMNNGQPVWLSQNGRHHPTEPWHGLFLLTRGWTNPFPEALPGMTFIQKRRR